MRRLKSTYTLLSDESPPSRREAASYNSGVDSSVQQFSWPEILSAETSTSTSTFPSAYQYSSSNFSDAIHSDPIAYQDVQNVMEHQHNIPKFDLLNDREELLFDEPRKIDISSADSEISFKAESLYDDSVHSDVFTPYPIVTSHGTVTIMLRHLVRVDITPDGAIYAQHFSGHSVAVVNSAGDKSCVLHSNSRVFQDGQCVHVMTYQNCISKICQRGVVFSSSSRSLAYLVDESGTKTTADRFLDLRGDFSLDVFYDQSQETIYNRSLGQCYDMVAKAKHKSYQNGDDVWLIGGTQIKQDRYGNIEVSRDYRRRILTILPAIREVSLETPFVSVTVGCYSKKYLSVQMDNRQITAGFCGFTVRNGTQKAGLDRKGKVVIF